MFLTTSKLELANYGASVQQLKERLNLPTDNQDGLGFLRNTCMEPYQASEAFVKILGDMFRNTVLTCIGAVRSFPLFEINYFSLRNLLIFYIFNVNNRLLQIKRLISKPYA